jgi:hypothetical protein
MSPKNVISVENKNSSYRRSLKAPQARAKWAVKGRFRGICGKELESHFQTFAPSCLDDILALPKAW